ncbi:putative molybdenum carrier protein [Leptolyngbya sp. O-77]|nr:putative molybdenum carrier protein [Leptolyngbya sp. O-77]
MNFARVVQILQNLKIISGGQTGVDRAAPRWGRSPTG